MCTFEKNLRFTDALSPVNEITLKPADSRLLTTFHASGNKTSADMSLVGYWAYGKFSLKKCHAP